jgi:hypothetical protein
MKCVVPLAGPDVLSPSGLFRPLMDYQGDALISKALSSRPWAAQLTPSDYIFVTRNTGDRRLNDFLSSNWPGSQNVVLPSMTDGAMISALSAVAMCPDDTPIVVDLADILFGCASLATVDFSKNLGLIIPTFSSGEDCYSYLMEDEGVVVRAAEKMVISDRASAGVYIFKDREIYVSACAHSIRNRSTLQHGGLYFVCPMANGVIDAGYEVSAIAVNNVIPISKNFH